MDFGSTNKVNVINQLKQSQIASEYTKNKRLQWMLTLIVVIVVLSFAKYTLDILTDYKAEAKTQLNLLTKLTNSANSPIDESLLTSITNHLQKQTEKITTVISSSTAEAQALEDIELNVGNLVTRKRLNLIGSEELTWGDQTFWSVRIEIAGQLEENKFVSLLKSFDSSNKNKRITSMQYSPKASNSINLVVDMLYMGTPK